MFSIGELMLRTGRPTASAASAASAIVQVGRRCAGTLPAARFCTSNQRPRFGIADNTRRGVQHRQLADQASGSGTEAEATADFGFTTVPKEEKQKMGALRLNLVYALESVAVVSRTDNTTPSFP